MKTAVCFGSLAVLFALASPVSAANSSLRVEGTEFVLRTTDGRVLRSPDLVGATFVAIIDDRKHSITIAAVEQDKEATGRIMLHHFRVKDEAGGFEDLCLPDAEGRRLGFPVPDGRDGFKLICTSGADGKCIRLGYRPWEERVGGPPLGALHRACIRMIRADYGGDDGTWTRDGIVIDIYDRYGVQNPDRTADMTFEAGWSESGAVCVAHARIREKPSLSELVERYPRLRSYAGPANCTEESARDAFGALLFSRSIE